MSKTHRYRRLALGAAILLAAYGLAVSAFGGSIPASASLRSALPVSRQQAALESIQPGNLSLRSVSAGPAPETKATPKATASQTDSSNNCISCHTSEALLKQLVPAPTVAVSSALTGTQGTAYTRTMPLWQQVLVDKAFLDDVPGCTSPRWGSPCEVPADAR